MNSLIWKTIPVSPKEVCLSRVLRCGQAFRWKNIDDVWSCGLKGRIVFLKQDSSQLYYSSVWPTKQESGDDTLELICDYLNVSINLVKLYEEWCDKDSNFGKHSEKFQGIRILRQDPWENLVSFICSTNNNVKRISQMCENLCVHFGEYLASHEGVDYYDFPTAKALEPPTVEQKLRNLGFGYRAKYINKTAQMIMDLEHDYLDQLRKVPYKDAHVALLQFSGVGPKVADCVCLMSLDKHDVVPIDTHVWSIAQRDYKLRSKTLNPKVYQEIGDYFRELWGPYAGWAHSVLFAADLSDLKNGVNIEQSKSGAKTINKQHENRKVLKKSRSVKQKVGKVKQKSAACQNLRTSSLL